MAIARILIVSRNLFIWSLLFLSVEVLGWPPVELGSVPATVVPRLPIAAEKYITKNLKFDLSRRFTTDCSASLIVASSPYHEHPKGHGPKIKVQMAGQMVFSVVS
jgi:hypothetical protein